MDHQECLAKRLEQWKEGDIDILCAKDEWFKDVLLILKKLNHPTRLKFLLILTSNNNGGRILPLRDDLYTQLKAEKHPDAPVAHLGSLFFEPIDNVPDAISRDQEIVGEMIRDPSLKWPRAQGIPPE